MINRDSFVASPEIQQLVTILTDKEEIHENKRSAVRESVVCPCLLYTSPSPRDLSTSRMPSSA